MFVLHKIEGRLKWLLQFNKKLDEYSVIFRKNDDDDNIDIEKLSKFPTIIFNHLPFKKIHHFLFYGSIYLLVAVITIIFIFFNILETSELNLSLNKKTFLIIFTFMLTFWHVYAETYHIQRLIEFKHIHRGGIFGTLLVIFFFFVLVPITILLLFTT